MLAQASQAVVDTATQVLRRGGAHGSLVATSSTSSNEFYNTMIGASGSGTTYATAPLGAMTFSGSSLNADPRR